MMFNDGKILIVGAIKKFSFSDYRKFIAKDSKFQWGIECIVN